MADEQFQGQPQSSKPPKKKSMNWMIWLILLIILFVLYFVFRPGDDSTNANTTTTNTSETSEVTNTETTTETSSAYDTFKVYAGDWTGNWNNTTFGSTGSVTATLTINEDGTAQLVLDVGGAVFGLVDPDPMTIDGNYDEESGLVFSTSGDSVFGDLTMTFATDGTVRASGLQVPATSLDTMTVEGTASETEISTTYRLTALGVLFAEGTLAMTKS